LALDCIDGVIGQTWSDTHNTDFPYNGTNVNDNFTNAFIEYSSYMDSVEGTNFYALADPMMDNTERTEEGCQYMYRQSIAAQLMQPEIHRFEASVWPSRGFGNVTSEYRTEQLNIFEALNEMSGKAITTSAGTPGITYLLSDSLSWQFGPSSWGLSSKDGYYGVTYPVISDGVPLKVRSMEQIRTADDLDDVTLLLLSWDCQKPLSEDVCDAIADWIMAGGTALYIGGYDKFADSEAEWWAAWGSPLQALLDKLGLDITASKSKPGTTAAWRW
jgi:hypothetical protein